MVCQRILCAFCSETCLEDRRRGPTAWRIEESASILCLWHPVRPRACFPDSRTATSRCLFRFCAAHSRPASHLLACGRFGRGKQHGQWREERSAPCREDGPVSRWPPGLGGAAAEGDAFREAPVRVLGRRRAGPPRPRGVLPADGRRGGRRPGGGGGQGQPRPRRRWQFSSCFLPSPVPCFRFSVRMATFLFASVKGLCLLYSFFSAQRAGLAISAVMWTMVWCLWQAPVVTGDHHVFRGIILISTAIVHDRS
jgi:hypothetical protein